MLYQLIGLPNFGLCMISDLKKRQPIEEIADEPYKPDSSGAFVFSISCVESTN